MVVCLWVVCTRSQWMVTTMTRESVSVFELVEAISGNWALLEHIRINVGMADEH